MPLSGVDFDAMHSFILVAEKQAFHEAAQALNLSPAALSRRIQRLEAALGIRLLDRSTRHLSLTAAGRLFLPKAQQITADLTSAVEQLRKLSRAEGGHLTLACLPSMAHHLLPRIIRDFRARFPEIHLRVTECGATAVVQAVRAARPNSASPSAPAQTQTSPSSRSSPTPTAWSCRPITR